VSEPLPAFCLPWWSALPSGPSRSSQPLTTRHYRLSIPHWHADRAGLRIAVLADLHVGLPFNGIPKLDEIVAITNELKPDLILIPGDFVIEDVIGGGLVPPEDSAAVPIKRGADHFWLVGISNFWEGASDVRKAMNLVTDDAPVLLFTHNPDVFPKLIRQ
jgi:predicted MPP superfamily phosphohydrolase